MGKYTRVGLMKAKEKEGCKLLESADKLTRSILNKRPHFAFAFTSKRRLSEPWFHLSLQSTFLHNYYLNKKELMRGLDSLGQSKL